MVIKLIGILFAMISCGSDNEVEVTGGSDNTVIIEHRVPICEDREIFDTKESIIACINAVNTLILDYDNLTPEQVDLLEGVVNDKN